MRPGQIAQLSYITAKNGNAIGKNFFFAVSEMDAESAAIHGFSVEKLALLSGGDTFLKQAEEILTDVEASDAIIAHNVKFDLNFLTTEFSRIGITPQLPKLFDTMMAFTPVCKLLRKEPYVGFKYPKLTELARHYSIDEARIRASTQNLFCCGESYHDARFDTCAVWLACQEGRKDCAEIDGILKSQDF